MAILAARHTLLHPLPLSAQRCVTAGRMVDGDFRQFFGQAQATHYITTPNRWRNITMSIKSLAIVVALALQSVRAAVPVYGQCGGIGYSGDTTCASGSTCVVSNLYYSQCVPGSAPPTTTAPSGGSSSGSGNSGSGGTASGTFNNPVIWEDLADLDVTRVGDTFYYSASTMHYSPGAPILRSYDLVNWEYIGHSVPTLDTGDQDYNLNGGRAYVRGIWASSLKYRASTSTWYWLGCIDFAKTYIYTTKSNPPTSGWTKAATLNTCYYDAGLLVDDDGTMYVAYGNTQISVAKLSSNGLSEASHQQVFSSSFTIEGSRFYKKNGAYYILVTQPASSEWVLKSTNGPFGPYTMKALVQSATSPYGGGNPHQGGLIDTPNGDWYYMAFIDSYPGGRMPALTPVTWGSDGFPSLSLSGNKWGASYPMPLTSHPVKSLTGTDTFTSIGPEWEWNHNPDNSFWSISNGLVLRTATVTADLYSAKNTLTHRILGPKSSGTILIDVTNMHDGDRTGLAMFRDKSAWIGVKQTGSTKQLVMVNGLNMDTTWATTSTGSEVATANLSGSQIYLRVTADIAPNGGKSATFSYSSDGSSFTNLGNTLALNTDWQYFMGYRFGIFNYATKATGGSVTVKSFTMQKA